MNHVFCEEKKTCHCVCYTLLVFLLLTSEKINQFVIISVCLDFVLHVLSILLLGNHLAEYIILLVWQVARLPSIILKSIMDPDHLAKGICP